MSERSPYEVRLRKERQDPKTEVLSIRIDADLKARMMKCCEGGPYRIGITALAERGIELAIQELTDLWATLERKKP